MKQILQLIIFSAVLALTMGCTKPDRSEEATQLKHELQDLLYKNPERALVRVDSAEQAGVFSAGMSNLLRTSIYGTMGQSRLAVLFTACRRRITEKSRTSEISTYEQSRKKNKKCSFLPR